MTQEETISNLKAYLDGNTAVGNIVPLRNILESAIKYLSEPSLPSNLDEAAEKWKEEHFRREYYQIPKDAMSRSFKAGAEWMAGQGVTCEGKVFTSAFTSYVKAPGIEELLKDAFPEDTEVIAQIRKKL